MGTPSEAEVTLLTHKLRSSPMGTSSEGEVTLFTHKFSPFAQRVQVALVEKGIPFKPIFVDFFNKSKEFLEANPIYQKVPAIVHNGYSLAESMIILEYLEDAFPESISLMPKDVVEKSKVRFWSDYLIKGFSIISDSFRLKRGTPEKQASVEAISKVIKSLDEAMSGFSAEGPFFTGDKFGFVDVVLCPLTVWLPCMALEGVTVPGPDETPRLHKWLEATKAHPSVKSGLPSEEETLEFFTAVIKRKEEAAAAAKNTTH